MLMRAVTWVYRSGYVSLIDYVINSKVEKLP